MEKEQDGGCLSNLLGLGIVLFIALIVIGSCSSSGGNESTGDEYEVDSTDIRSAVQLAVEEEEMISDVDWPWGDEDYNISEVGDMTYTANGQFEHNGYRYDFDVKVQFNGNDTYNILECSVSR